MTTAIETKADLKEALLHYLKYGEENAIPGPQLASILGLKDTRPMRITIIDLISEGTPVCGNAAHGYFIANSIDEVNAELNLLRNKYGMNLLRRYASLKRAGRSLLQPGQLTLKI